MREKKIAIITDTGCDMPNKIYAQYNIQSLPLRIIFSDAEYASRSEIDNSVLYEKMTREYPKTSLPTRDDIYTLFDELQKNGTTDVIYLSISSGLSGTYNAMRLLAEEYCGITINVVDTKTLSVCQGYCVMEAAREIEKTGSIERAIRKTKELRAKMTALIALPTLEYIHKGGRISNIEGTLGSLLHINPVITVNSNGNFETLSKTIGFNRAMESMFKIFLKKFGGKRVKIGITHGCARTKALQVLERLKKLSDVQEYFIEEVSPVLGVHTGKGLIGIVVIETE